MSHLLIPGPATATSATMWAAAIDERDDPASLQVVAATGQPQSIGTWDHQLQGGKHRVNIRRLRFDGLAERSRRPIELQRAGTTVATATLGTLPRALPGLEERPFTVLLGSCFAQKRDGAGNVGRTYSLLPAGVRPDIKILCGDQVYLDAPSFWTVFPALTIDDLRRRLLDSYLAAWTQEPGFHSLLADGPNAFSADDHDFWNNAPNGSITAPATLISKRRAEWWTEATKLYRAFQRPDTPALTEMKMVGLSICVADVRANRTPTGDPTPPDDRFMSEADLRAIRDWASNLRTPGCLALGQVLFAQRAGRISRHMDLGLPDYTQYGKLLEALSTARHSIVILTGDVHFGRVAVCELSNGKEIVEVVASPLSLVAPIPENEWKPAPHLFPADESPGLVRRSIRTEAAYQYNGNHFATIEFSGAGGKVRLKVQAWPTDTKGQAPPRPVRSYVHWIS